MNMEINNDNSVASSSISWKLFCQVVDDRNKLLGSFFSVRIATTADVDDLKKDIYKILPKGAQEHFARLSPTDLDLWKLCIDLSTKDKFEDRLVNLPFTDLGGRHEAQLLNPSSEIGECWDSEPPKQRLHLVVRSQAVRPDETLNDFKAFHAQYWGHPLDASLTTIPSTDDPELGKEMDTSGDVLPGDPFREVLGQTILVRAEYIRVFDEVKQVYEHDDHKRFVVMTGQSGIGKTLWIPYAICRCLGDEQAVLWFQYGKFYEFSARGVLMSDSPSGDYQWCFVDSADVDQLPTAIYHPYRKLFPIYVTSPKKARWDKFQARLHSLIIMNPWTKDELLKACGLYPEQMPGEVLDRFDEAGPSASLCLTFSKSDILQFYDDQKSLISGTSQDLMQALLDSKGQLRMDSSSRKFYVIRRLVLAGTLLLAILLGLLQPVLHLLLIFSSHHPIHRHTAASEGSELRKMSIMSLLPVTRLQSIR